MKTKIAVVTGTRAEYGLLVPIMHAIQDHSDLDLQLWVTGMHLLHSYGHTIDTIRADGWNVDAKIYMYDEHTESSHTQALSRAISRFSEEVMDNRPDWVLVLGDRLEPFSAVQAASMVGVPIAHVHGGDRTSGGNIDEQIRHAISRFANIHFPASEQSANRLKLMGEEDWRIHNVGAPGVDVILSTKLLSRMALGNLLKIAIDSPFVLCVQHSVTSQYRESYEQMSVTLDVLSRLNTQAVIVYPNNDIGSEGIIRAIEEHSQNPLFSIHKSLDQRTYLSLMKYASALIGNSSSGLLEAPSFGVPMIHVGIRNLDREHADNVQFVDHDPLHIEASIVKAMNDEAYRQQVMNTANPFGDGRAGLRIADVLSRTPVNDRLMQKRITF